MAKITFLRGFKFRRRKRLGFQLSNPTVTPVSVVATGAVGSLSIQVNTGALPGVAGTGAVGTALAQVSTPALSGVSATGQIGTVVAQYGPIGVQATGQVGSVLSSVFAIPAGVTATGQVGTTVISSRAFISGVQAIGTANPVFPIPPAPLHRPPLLIPSQNGLPASLWLGS